MKKKLALTVLVAAVSWVAPLRSGAADGPADADVITPLNVRDPSALIMAPPHLQEFPATGAVSAGVPGATAQDRLSPAAATEISAGVLSNRDGAARRCAARKLSSDRSERFDKALLTDGKRAVKVPFQEDQLLDLRNGDRIDVLVVFDAAFAGGIRRRLSATLLQNVKIIGVAHADDAACRGVLTLLLNPTEAQFAVLAAREGSLYAALRSAADVEMHPMEMADFGRLFH